MWRAACEEAKQEADVESEGETWKEKSGREGRWDRTCRGGNVKQTFKPVPCSCWHIFICFHKLLLDQTGQSLL